MYLDEGKKVIKRYVDTGLLPGAVFAYVTKDFCEKDLYGYKSLVPSKTELTLNTLYDLASLSKVVGTSTMILKLIEEGTVSLKTKVSSILPDFPYENITIGQLMTHSSGMMGDEKGYKKCHNENELWNYIIHELPLAYETGTKCVYSCNGFIVLGKIIEHYKNDLPRYLNEVLCEPLDTKDLLYQPWKYSRQAECAPTEVTEQRGIIQGYSHDGKSNILNGIAGNAGLFANIDALVKFAQMMLNNGNYNGNQILQGTTMDLFKKQYTTNMNELRTIGGWFAGDQNQSDGDYISECSIYHTGFTGTSIYIDFTRQCAIILLANAIHPSRTSIMKEIRNLFHNQVLKESDRIQASK